MVDRNYRGGYALPVPRNTERGYGGQKKERKKLIQVKKQMPGFV